MPKRAVIAIVTTALALVLLLSFKTPDSSALRSTGNGGNLPAATSGVAAGTSAPGVAAGTSAPGVAGGTAAPTPAATGQATLAPAAGGLADGTVMGPALDTRFGPVQVQVTVANGKVTDVTALQLPFDRSRSAQISQYAEPILRSEALQAQTAKIDLVSGATYTSDAYAQSLQAALDQAHA
ncbi:MAG: FMN-binding protein [Chloroflexota bacterium]